MKRTGSLRGKIKTSLSILFLSLIFTMGLDAQIFDNASFEGTPVDATVPVGWFPCAPKTTPDILPGPWGVTLDPSDGNSYVGLITRSDGSYESISQRIPLKLEKGQCYHFTLDLAKSMNYAAANSTIKLEIFLSTDRCLKDQKIFDREVDSYFWETRKVKFEPNIEAKYLILQAYFIDSSNMVSGNILIDNLSEISSCSKT